MLIQSAQDELDELDLLLAVETDPGRRHELAAVRTTLLMFAPNANECRKPKTKESRMPRGPCPACNGNGFYGVVQGGWPGRPDGWISTQRCGGCNGSGQIEKPPLAKWSPDPWFGP